MFSAKWIEELKAAIAALGESPEWLLARASTHKVEMALASGMSPAEFAPRLIASPY